MSGGYYCFSSKCKKTFDIQGLINHMDDKHPESVHSEAEMDLYVYDVSTRTKELYTRRLVTCEFGEFWVELQFMADHIYAAAQYLGPKRGIKDLLCEFEMCETSPNGKETGLRCIYEVKILSETDNFDNAFKQGRCFVVCRDFAKYFIDKKDDSLEITMTISQND